MPEPSLLSFTNVTSVTAAILAALAAIFSGWCAYLSYKLSAKLREEMKSDERLIVSKIIHPGLAVRDHDKCVIKLDIFNKSKRKAYINKVQAYDRNNNLMDITWSNHINDYGNPENPCALIGIVDTEELFVRLNIGEEIDFCRLEVFHSFSSVPITAIFDPYVKDFG